MRMVWYGMVCHCYCYRYVANRADTVAAARRKEGRERLFHIDDPSASALPISPAMTSLTDSKALSFLKLATPDPVCCVTATQTTLLVGRASGTLMKYSLPHLTFEQRYQVRCRPQILALNCDSSRVSIIDINGVLILFDLDAKPEGPKGTPGKQLDFERKDAWDMKWSDDNPELFAW
jgi:WD repeat-containing protein 35